MLAGLPARNRPRVAEPMLAAGSELDVPTLSGSWSVDGETVSFRPRFPLARGLRVRAEFRPPEGSGAVEEFVWGDAEARFFAVYRIPSAEAGDLTAAMAWVDRLGEQG